MTEEDFWFSWVEAVAGHMKEALVDLPFSGEAGYGETTFQDSGVDDNVVLLLASILDFTDTTVMLFRQGRVHSGTAVLRPAMEAAVDLVNLAHDPKHLKVKRAAYLRDMIAGNKRLMDSDIPDADRAHYRESLAWQEEELAQLDKQGYTKISLFKQFKAAGLEDWYKYSYSDLCMQTHNNLGILWERNVKLNATVQTYELALGEQKGLLFYLTMVSEVLSKASIAALAHFASPHLAELQGLEKHYEDQLNRHYSPDDLLTFRHVH